VAEPGADGQDHVGGAQRLRAGAPVGEHAVEKGVVLAHRPPTGDRREHRGAETPGHRLQLALGPGRDHPAAGHDQRPRRPRQQGGRVLDIDDVAGRPRAVAAGGLRRLHPCREEIVGDREHHRPRPAGAQQVEGAGNRARNRACLGQRLRPARHRAEALDLVRDLVEGAEVPPDQVGGDVGGDQHDRDGARVRLDQGRQCVGGAGPGRHQRDAGLAARAGVAVGHERGARLVAGQHVDDVPLAQQRVVDRQVVEPRDAEDVPHALAPQRLDDEIAAGRPGAHREGGVGVRIERPRAYLASIADRI
jgi:hypothetical protein